MGQCSGLSSSRAYTDAPGRSARGSDRQSQQTRKKLSITYSNHSRGPSCPPPIFTPCSAGSPIKMCKFSDSWLWPDSPDDTFTRRDRVPQVRTRAQHLFVRSLPYSRRHEAREIHPMPRGSCARQNLIRRLDWSPFVLAPLHLAACHRVGKRKGGSHFHSLIRKRRMLLV